MATSGRDEQAGAAPGRRPVTATFFARGEVTAPRTAATASELAEPPEGYFSEQPKMLERVAQIVIMLIIGTAAGAGSFSHVHDVAAAHGQAGWLAWSDAVVLELMSIAAGLELRHRKRVHAPVALPAAVMATAVAVSLGAQVVDAERSPIGWIAAAIPALGFLTMVKIALAQPGTTPPHTPASQPPSASPPPTPADAGPPCETRLPTPRAPNIDPVVENLLPAARAAVADLDLHGRRLSRHALAQTLRTRGHAVSNARTSALLAILKAEQPDRTPLRILEHPTTPDTDQTAPASTRVDHSRSPDTSMWPTPSSTRQS